MTDASAAIMLQDLLDGFDPVTGRALDDEHVCWKPEVQQALGLAIGRLQLKRPTASASAAGAPSDCALVDTAYSTWGPSAANSQLKSNSSCAQGGRSGAVFFHPKSIRARSSEPKLKKWIRPPERKRSGAKWTSQDDQILRAGIQRNQSIEEIALSCLRGTFAIKVRIHKLGLHHTSCE